MDGGGIGLKNEDFHMDCLTENFEVDFILNSDETLEL